MSGRRRRSESLWDRKEEMVPQTEISEKSPWQSKELHSSFRGDSSPKRSNSEANDALMFGDFSGKPSREPMRRNESMSTENNNSSDGHRLKTEPAFDEWENRYSSRRSDDSYCLPYRGGDRGVGGTGNMSKDRDRSRSRSWSPRQSRGRDRGSTRGLARSRSRSRSRSRGRDRGRARSPFSDERRESYEYADVRNDSRVSSRPCKDFAAGNCRRGSQCRFFHQELVDSRGGGNRLDGDLAEKWSSRPDYSGGSRYGDDRNSADRPRNKGLDGYRKDIGRNEEARDTSKDEYICRDFIKGRCRRGASCGFPHHTSSADDYHKGNRNAYVDEDRRRQSNQSSTVLCKFFTMGKCHRNNCKFSHEASKSGGYEGRSHDNIQGHNSGNNNRPWNDLQPQNQVTASGFSDFAKSSHNFDDKNKSWNGPSWNDLESGGFDEMSHDNIQGRTLDDKNRTWDPPGWNESGKNACGLSQLTSVTNDMDMTSNEVRGMGNQESQLIRDSSQSHILDARSQHVVPGTSGSQLANAITAIMPEVPGNSCFQQHQKQGDGSVAMVIDNSDAHNVVSGVANQQIPYYGEDFIQRVHNMASQFPSTLNGTERSSNTLALSSSNGPKVQSNGSVQGIFLHLDLQKQTEIQNKQGGKPRETSEKDITQEMHDLSATVASTEQVPHVISLPVSLPQISQNRNLTNARELLYALPTSASSGAQIDSVAVQQNLDTKSKEQYESARDLVAVESIKTSVPMDILSNSLEQENQMSVGVSTGDPNSSKFRAVGIPDAKKEPVGNLEVSEKRVAENPRHEQEKTNPGKSEAQGKVEECNISNAEKAMRQFKVALVEFVKEILKPTWKEGKMSREVYKTIVKKVVDKVTSTIQGIQIPRTQEKIDQYLAFSKSKITKLVEAYVGRLLKA